MKEQSKMSLLFIGKSVPPQIKRALKKYLAPIIVKYDTLEQPPADEKYRLNIIGESFSGDFCSVINFANSVGLALTKEKQMPSKSTVVKIDSVLFNKDFLLKDLSGIDKIHSIEDTNRIYGILMLLVESNLLYASGDTMDVSEGAETFFCLRLEDKCRYLFKHYLKSRRIYELHRIIESDYKTELKGNMTECRNVSTRFHSVQS